MSIRKWITGVRNALMPRRAYGRCSRSAVEGPSGSTDHPDGGHKLFKNIALFVAFPILLVVMAKCYAEEGDHEHRPPFIAYEYLRRRTKRFPWGDGTKSLFHNDRTNALPDGYVDGRNDDEECDDE